MIKNKIFLLPAAVLMFLISCTVLNERQEQQVTCAPYSDYNEWYAWVSGPLCKSDTCSTYQAIWKELFLERNNLTSDFFDRHIIPCSSGVGSWNEGISFGVCYKVVIGWAVVYRCDQFIIKIKKDNNLYSNLRLPKDILLTEENIRIALDHDAFGSSITHLSGDESLLFNSNQAAMGKLIRDSHLNTLCFRSILLNEAGHVMLDAGAQYAGKENSCVEGHIDLINGETSFTDLPCYYTAKESRN